jgi:V/A-type H+-transporting ATPase subunit K
MEASLYSEIGIAASFGLSVVGAALGMGVNGPAAIGAWKKCYAQNRPAPFILVAFAGTVLSNIIYGFITMNVLADSVTLKQYQLVSMGIFAGLAIGAAAYTQAICAASAADAYAETGQGFGNYLIVVGIAETVALFAMVFTLLRA